MRESIILTDKCSIHYCLSYRPLILCCSAVLCRLASCQNNHSTRMICGNLGSWPWIITNYIQRIIITKMWIFAKRKFRNKDKTIVSWDKYIREAFVCLLYLSWSSLSVKSLLFPSVVINSVVFCVDWLPVNYVYTTCWLLKVFLCFTAACKQNRGSVSQSIFEGNERSNDRLNSLQTLVLHIVK